MAVQYAKTYVDRVVDSRDVATLYDIVRTLDAERDLPEPFKLLVRLWEWSCSTRSGIWQYYEGLARTEVDKTANLMERCGLGELATRCRAGMENWDEPEYCADLDNWIDQNWASIEDAAIRLVDGRREYLYPVSE